MISPTEPSPRPAAPGARLPGPRGLDALAFARQYRQRPLEAIVEARARYGAIFVVETGLYPPAVIATDHPAIRHALFENAANYVKSYSYDGLGLLTGKGLITSDGALWRRQRKMIQPGFPPGHVNALVDRFAAATARTLDRLAGQDEVDLHAELVRLTLTMVGEALFGADLGHRVDAVSSSFATSMRFIDAYNDALVNLPLWVPTAANRRFHAARSTLFELVDQIIAERRQQPAPRDDLLSVMMRARDEDGGQAMDDTQLRDEVMTMLIAGHETIAAALAWLFHILPGAPEVEARLVEEAQGVLGGRPVTAADLPHLSYATQAVSEAMRLYPPVWMIERCALGADTLGGYRVEPGHVISISPYLIQRDPADWPDPERFDPERFRPEAVAARRKLAYIPFGAGPRRCLGERIALTKAQVIIPMLLARYRLRPASGHVVEAEASLTLRPRDGVRVHLSPRQTADR